MASAGNSPHVPTMLATHLPFVLHYAWLLAQWGLVPQALQYCAWIVQLHSSKGAPHGLHMCRALTDELQARLQAYAQVCAVVVGNGGGVEVVLSGAEVDVFCDFECCCDILSQACCLFLLSPVCMYLQSKHMPWAYTRSTAMLWAYTRSTALMYVSVSPLVLNITFIL